MATPKRLRSATRGVSFSGAESSAQSGKRVRRAHSASSTSGGGSTGPSSDTGSGSEDGLDDAGKEFVFRLKVIQQPRRARACGFGDKDHRPLSPIPVIQLRVYYRNGDEVAADDVDIGNLVLCIDLWSADGSTERNVVRHPANASQRRQSPDAATSSSSPGQYNRQGTMSESSHGPSSAYNSPYTHQSTWPSPVKASPLILPSLQEAISPTNTHGPLPSALPPRGLTTGWTAMYQPDVRPVTAPSSYGRGGGPQTLPPFVHLNGPPRSGRSNSLTNGDTHRSSHSSTLSPIISSRRDSSLSAGTDYSLAPTDYSFGRRIQGSRPLSSSSTANSSWMTDSRPPSATVPGPSRWGSPHTHYSLGGISSTNAESLPSSRPSSGYFAPRAMVKAEPASVPTPRPATAEEDSYSSGSSESTDHGSYSRVLVGLLGEVCHKLQGTDGQLGLFFFPRSLGVRTEGSFALKCTLVQFEPEPPPNGSTARRSAVLSQCQTEPFEVYPAKRFPGVCPLTEMTRHFSRQGVRLPMRRKVVGSAEASDEEDEDE